MTYFGACSKASDMNILENDVATNGSILYCKDSAKGYIVYAHVTGARANASIGSGIVPTTGMGASSSGASGYYCIDSTGKSATLAKAPTGLVCK